MTSPVRVPLSPADRLTLLYLAALSMLALVYHPEPFPLLARFAALAAALAASAALAARSSVARIAHDFAPIVTMACIFNWTGPVILATDPPAWDGTLLRIDQQLFGTLAARWFGLLGRPWWLTDAAALAYASYYFVPVVMAVALYVAGRRADFDDLVLTVVATLLLTYACYFVLPASGPRVPQADEGRVLGGSLVSAGIRTALRHAEGNLLDAFPSGHTTVSLVYLACGWRLFPRWRAPLALLVAGILFSTVYLSLHYVVDVVAGVALAAILPLVLPRLRRWTSATQPINAPPPGFRRRNRRACMPGAKP
jgi:membrane-associated phospholipid phosphatase